MFTNQSLGRRSFLTGVALAAALTLTLGNGQAKAWSLNDAAQPYAGTTKDRGR